MKKSILLNFNLLAIVFSVALAGPVKRETGTEIIALITQLTNDANTAATDLSSFPTAGGTLAQALAIHTALTTLDSDLRGGTSSLLASSTILTEADGATIVSDANNGLTPAIINVFTGIDNFESGDTLPPVGGIGNIVKSDGSAVEADSTAFYNALKALLPFLRNVGKPDLQGDLIFPSPPVHPANVRENIHICSAHYRFHDVLSIRFETKDSTLGIEAAITRLLTSEAELAAANDQSFLPSCSNEVVNTLVALHL
ncbi:hypothetical protein NP233_g475 [Leucocoprinus birnbaumii]|uniref:Uncharacterized protein n=1 Tax=Leucocoprinus birnbaumii TaxID=56174 RepID=A0AAD5W5G1_9AGAR|nr:hypothetical protein NP233_g475 [Leucocoprinus birnbaumii]